MSGPRPPAWLERLAFLPSLPASGDAWYLLGDLREEYADRCAATSPFRANAWFLREAVRARIQLRTSRSRPAVTSAHASAHPPHDNRVASMMVEIRQSVRGVVRRPRFAFMVALMTGTGIGAAVALAAVLRSVVFTPLPWPEPERVHALETRVANLDWMGSSGPEFLDFREGLSSFEALGGYGYGFGTLGDSLSARRVRVAYLTAEVLPLLGAVPALGRYFTPEEDVPGTARVALLSHDTWQREHGGDPAILGSTIELSGQARTVIGVMPAGFDFPSPDIAVWVPWRLALADGQLSRSNHFLFVLGRLRPGVTPEAAGAELRLVTDRLAAEYPADYSSGLETRLRPYLDRVLGDVRGPLWLLVAASLLLLGIATVNVSMLVAGRRVARSHESAVRVALGSGRIRAAAPQLVEAWLGILAGGAAGIWAAWAVVRAVRSAGITALPRTDLIQLTPDIALAGGAGTVLVGLIATLCALAAGRNAGLGASSRTMAGSRYAYRSIDALVAAQIALAVTLCIAAGLMVRTTGALNAVDPGVDADGVLTALVTPRGPAYDEAAARIAFHDALRERLLAIPGVTAAGAALNLPYAGRFNSDWTFQREEDQDLSVGDSPVATVQMVTPGYFEAAGLAVEGRSFSTADRADAPPVIIVNRTMAQRFWPGRSAIGQRMRAWSQPEKPWMEIVGVVEDVHSFGLDRPAPPIYYLPTTQSHLSTFFTPGEMTVLVRTAGDPLSVAGPVRTAITSVDATVAISSVQPFEDVVRRSLGHRPVTLRVLAAYSAIALALAGIGVWALLTAVVQARRREIGIRLALGERVSRIGVRLVVRTLTLVFIGTLAGIAVALSGARLLASVLFGVQAWDPVTIGGVVLVLGGTALIAAALPALTAMRVRPLEALREDGG